MSTNLKPTSVRERIMQLEEQILSLPGMVYGDQPSCPLKHSFGDGIYVREIFNPKGALIVTKIHKYAHPFFLLKGEMTIITESGQVRIKAPHYGITPAGTKRVIFVHEDVTFVTVHPTKLTDPKEIEEEIIAKNFDEVDFSRAINVRKMEELEEGERCLS